MEFAIPAANAFLDPPTPVKASLAYLLMFCNVPILLAAAAPFAEVSFQSSATTLPPAFNISACCGDIEAGTGAPPGAPK